MSDFATSLRVIAAYKAGEDLADRLATAVAVQQSMSVALNKAADEIERLRLTDDEREAIRGLIYGFIESDPVDAYMAATLRNLLERLK